MFKKRDEKVKHVFPIVICLVFSGCTQRQAQPQLASIQLIDRNGFQETISVKERLEQYEAADFSEPQVYQKVVRTYNRGEEGKARSVLTTYHDNGLLKQYLESENGRARGTFIEYYDSGKKKVEATVIEGIADVKPEAMHQWVFDGFSQAWDEEGNRVAEIQYAKGKLQGDSVYYHSNGEIKKVVPYERGLIHGVVKEYDTFGKELATISYVNGEKHGTVEFLGNPSFEEVYAKGKLVQGIYRAPDGSVTSEVKEGNGIVTTYTDGVLSQKSTVEKGVFEGSVWLYNANEELASIYTLHDGEKHGLETVFYEDGLPKLLITWHEGEVKGQVKSWYANGNVQNEMEMHDNVRHGLSVSWYEDGSLMHTEQYESGKLLEGKYFDKGDEKHPVSYIEKGTGVATLYDKKGILLEKVQYDNGAPKEE